MENRKKRSQDRGTQEAGKGANGETKQGKVRGYAGVENDKGQRAFGIQMRQNGVMEELQQSGDMHLAGYW